LFYIYFLEEQARYVCGNTLAGFSYTIFVRIEEVMSVGEEQRYLMNGV
jgi:hypothetical protein